MVFNFCYGDCFSIQNHSGLYLIICDKIRRADIKKDPITLDNIKAELISLAQFYYITLFKIQILKFKYPAKVTHNK